MNRFTLPLVPVLLLSTALVLPASELTLDEALAGASGPEPMATAPVDQDVSPTVPSEPATASANTDRAEGKWRGVSKLLAGGGQGRVTDGQADAVVRRLAKLRADLAGRRGGDEAALLAECDADGDGKVSLPEARAAVAQARPGVDPRARHADTVIAAVDTDSDGLADARELAAHLGSLATVRVVVEPVAVKLWKTCDTDRDGALSVAEARLAADQFGRLLLYGGESQTPVEDPTAWVQVVQVIERADADCSNGLSAAEVASTTVFKEWFERIDRDANGEVSAPELYVKAADLAKVGQGEICQTCPLVKKEGGKKLELLQGLITLR